MVEWFFGSAETWAGLALVTGMVLLIGLPGLIADTIGDWWDTHYGELRPQSDQAEPPDQAE